MEEAEVERYIALEAERREAEESPGMLSVVLSNCDTRTPLTQREFVIATGHHSRSRTNRLSA